VDFEDFAAAVREAGLEARQCTPMHWQIRGGERLVNCWPVSGRLRIYVDRTDHSTLGTLKEALRAAGARPRPAPAVRPEVVETPPWEPVQRPVGLLRRLWRFLW